MDRCFKYCVLRLMPDPVRGEVVNIGLIIFTDGGIDLRIGKNLAKAQALVPHLSIDGLDELKEELGDIAGLLNPEEALPLLKSYGPFTVSELGYFTANDDKYEAKIEQIMRWLVSPPAKPSAREGRSRLATEIRSELKRHKLLGNSIEEMHKNKVVAGYELPGEDDLAVDFAIKNGLYRFTQVIDYRTTPKSVHSKIKEVSIKAIAIHQAPRALDVKKDDVKGYALVWVPPEFADVAHPHLKVLHDFTDEILHYDNPRDRNRYWEMISAWTHQQGPLI